ncbi:MAG: hypothetical protein LBQ12_09100, partial [Deltaproteobacteria bacterium]|nr:hypothetical protein [Deltaproteobacteria bacterium]
LFARLAYSGVFVGAAIAYCSAGHPYRQDSELWFQSSPARIPAGGGTLLLSEERARYVGELQAGASAAGFREGDVLTDLSGRAPGASFALGGFMPGSLWIASGYPGSGAWLARGLGKLSCGEIASSWLLADLAPLVEPLDPRLLTQHGAKVPEDFATAARASFADPAGPGLLYMHEHRLLKPARPFQIAEEACLLSRAGGRDAGGTEKPGSPEISGGNGAGGEPGRNGAPENPEGSGGPVGP